MATVPVKPPCEDFQPYCKCRREEGQDTLEVHVHGFKKEQMRVQLAIQGTLVVKGERPLDDGRLSRFCKEIRVSGAYKTNEIHAKLSNGILRLVMPKRKPLISTPPSQDQPPILPRQYQEKEMGKPMNNGINNIATNATTQRSDGAGEGTIAPKEATLSHTLVSKCSIFNITLVLALLIAIGAFLMCKYCQPSSHT